MGLPAQPGVEAGLGLSLSAWHFFFHGLLRDQYRYEELPCLLGAFTVNNWVVWVGEG